MLSQEKQSIDFLYVTDSDPDGDSRKKLTPDIGSPKKQDTKYL